MPRKSKTVPKKLQTDCNEQNYVLKEQQNMPTKRNRLCLQRV